MKHLCSFVTAFLLFSLFIANPAIAEKTKNEAIKKPTLDFTLLDAKGNKVKLSDYRGKIVVLHFWATWCPYCKRLQPGLEKLVESYADNEVVLLGVSFSEGPSAQPQKELELRGHKFTTLLNGEAVAKQFKVKGTPTTVFINQQGEKVSFTTTANPDAPMLKNTIEHMLGSNNK